MKNFSEIKISELKGSRRIDADRYRQKYLELESDIKKIPTSEKLVNLLKKPIRTGNTPPNREFLDGDERVFWIKTDTLRDGMIKFENSDFLPKRVLSKSQFLIPDEIIVTIIGADFNIIARASIFSHNNPVTVVNQNIAVIRADKSKIDPHYLVAFLNSFYGQNQLWMLSRQTEQVNLNCREVEEIYVPLFDDNFQLNISTKTKKFFDNIEKAKNLYSEAKKLVDKESGTDKLIRTENTYSVPLSYVISKKRMDAEYFRPIYEEAAENIKNYSNGYEDLVNVVKVIDTNVKHKLKPDEKYQYVELSDIDPTVGVIHNPDDVFPKDLPSRAKRILKTNDVIVSNVEGSLNRVALVSPEYKDAIATNGFFQFKAQTISPELFLALAKSKVLQLQLKREATGTILSSVPPNNLNNVKIPIFENGIQQKITELVKKSHDLWNGAIYDNKNTLKEIETKIQNANS